mmetsp:Transcript_14395/g.48792  ORF Transcript_14395/g.48792 Transcript_14395/m.48792 type:complete len:245 (+) Transcript_14395:647-1381(+)
MGRACASSLRPITRVTSVPAELTKKRPGSAMSRTPLSAGKWRSRASRRRSAMDSKVAPRSSDPLPGSGMPPGKPPPISSRAMGAPSDAAMSKAWRAARTASTKGSAPRQPLPTWKLTPCTARPRSWAVRRSAGTRRKGAPYFWLMVHTAWESSTRMRMRSRARGCLAATLASSSSLSKTVRSTPTRSAWARWAGCLHGLAYTMRAGSTPRPRMRSISALLAQSKPAPPAASVATTFGSGLHLTA